MKIYKAVRLSLTEARILNGEHELLCTIRWPAAKIWSTENAPISDHLGENFKTNIELNIEGQKFVAKRKLLTNKVFNNKYEVSILNEQNQRIAVGSSPGVSSSIKIGYDEKNYELRRDGFFRFDFSLLENGYPMARFTEITPFFTFTSRKDFLIVESVPTKPVLISFCFFLAHNLFFK